MQLQQRAGAPNMELFWTTSQRSQRDMSLLLGQIIKQKLIGNVKASRYFSIAVDEETDCAALEQMLIHIGWVVTNGGPHFQFLEAIYIQEKNDATNAVTLTNAIITELQSCNLPLDTLCGFGSDGASVMVGVRNGASTRMQQLCPIMVKHQCINHHLALACGDANDTVIHNHGGNNSKVMYLISKCNQISD